MSRVQLTAKSENFLVKKRDISVKKGGRWPRLPHIGLFGQNQVVGHVKM